MIPRPKTDLLDREIENDSDDERASPGAEAMGVAAAQAHPAFADPIDARLLDHFYNPPPRRARTARSTVEKPRPTHYKIVCISLYTEDIERLERLVADLKGRGHTKANKSQIIRAALDQVDLSKIPKGY